MTAHRAIAPCLIVWCAMCLGSEGFAQSVQNQIRWRPTVHRQWQAEADMPDPVSSAAVGEVNGVIYVAGGTDSNGPTAAFQAYDPATNTWSSLASLPETLYQGDGTGTINHRLYVVGGWNGTLPTNKLYVYRPGSDRWKRKARMPHLSACGISGVINQKLYVVTPCDGYSGYRQDLDVYDPVTDTWTSLAQSAAAHSQPAGAVINGKLYVAGGQNGNGITDVTEAYDPTTNTWTTLARMRTPVMNPASAALDGKFWVFGGFDGTNVLSIVQIYDPVRNRWKTSSLSMPAPNSQAGTAVVHLTPYVEGGSNGSTIVGTNEALVRTAQ